MDDHELKLLVSATDGDEAGAHMALDRLRESLSRSRNSGREIVRLVAGFDKLIALNLILQNDVTKWQTAYEQWKAHALRIDAVAARLQKLREWIAFNRKKAVGGVALLAMGALALNFYGPGTGPAAVAAREAADKALHSMAVNSPWSEGETEPRVYALAGRPHWVIGRGDIETELHADGQGQAVEMHCLHLFAVPAVSDYGAYLKPASRNSPSGWFSWPERATDCKAAATRKVEK